MVAQLLRTLKNKGKPLAKIYAIYLYSMILTVEACLGLGYFINGQKPIQSKYKFIRETGLVDITPRIERLKYGSHKMRQFLGL